MLIDGLKHGDNGMVMPGIGHESLMLPVQIDAAPGNNERIFFPTDSVIDQSVIRSIEVYDSNWYNSYFSSTQLNVIDPADMRRFVFSLQVDDSLSILAQMPLQSVNPELRQGKKMSMCIKGITTAQCFVQRLGNAPLVTAFPFIIPFMFYYRSK